MAKRRLEPIEKLDEVLDRLDKLEPEWKATISGHRDIRIECELSENIHAFLQIGRHHDPVLWGSKEGIVHIYQHGDRKLLEHIL